MKDPTKVRVSDTLLLSDLVGCDSVYRYGYANPVEFDKRSDHWKEAKKLGALLDNLCDEYGPYIVSYGYISPQLSRKIVKYQDPDKPSYHRFDLGAAADVCFPDWEEAPIYLAHSIDGDYDYSRMITYSESKYICVATQACRCSQHRALYENRYVGARKPEFVKYSPNEAKRSVQKASHELPVDWAGAGYPTYHGGGKRQFHHRTRLYSAWSDFLYNRDRVHNGARNIPPLEGNPKHQEFSHSMYVATVAYARAVESTGWRHSVIEAYNGGNWPYTDIVPSACTHHDDLAQALVRGATKVRVLDHGKMKKVRIYDNEQASLLRASDKSKSRRRRKR